MAPVLVFVDHVEGSLTRVSTQVLTAAGGLDAEAVHAAAFGPGAQQAGAAAGAHGATTAFCWPGAEAGEYVTEPAVAGLVAALEASQARTLLYPADPFLGDVVARTAIRVGAGVITDASDLTRSGDRVAATKQIFGGEMVSRCEVAGDRLECIGVRPNAFAAVEPGADAPVAEVVTLDVVLDETATRARITEVVEAQATERPDMVDAPIVCVGGRGLGEAAGFRLVEELADVLGGAVGASRPATDAGWYPHQHQIGQTGKTVAPQLYVGLGVSGAIQHRTGMQTAQTIVAVNIDPEAPIFSIADLGVVGDLHTIVPALIDELRRRGGDPDTTSEPG